MSDGTTELFKPALVLGARWRKQQVRMDPEAHEIHFKPVCEGKRLLYLHCAAADQSIHGRQLRDREHLHFIQYRRLIHVAIPRVGCSEFAAAGTGDYALPLAAVAARTQRLLAVVRGDGAHDQGTRVPTRQIGAPHRRGAWVNAARLWRSSVARVDGGVCQARRQRRRLRAYRRVSTRIDAYGRVWTRMDAYGRVWTRSASAAAGL